MVGFVCQYFPPHIRSPIFKVRLTNFSQRKYFQRVSIMPCQRRRWGAGRPSRPSAGCPLSTRSRSGPPPRIPISGRKCILMKDTMKQRFTSPSICGQRPLRLEYILFKGVARVFFRPYFLKVITESKVWRLLLCYAFCFATLAAR